MEKTLYKVGDIVVPSEKLLQLEPYIKKLKLKIIQVYPDKVYARILEAEIDSDLTDEIEYCEELYKVGKKYTFLLWEIIKEVAVEECNCKIETLMLKGCQCGGD